LICCPAGQAKSAFAFDMEIRKKASAKKILMNNPVEKEKGRFRTRPLIYSAARKPAMKESPQAVPISSSSMA